MKARYFSYMMNRVYFNNTNLAEATEALINHDYYAGRFMDELYDSFAAAVVRSI